MKYRNIGFKLILYISLIVIAVFSTVVYLNIRDQKKQLLDEVIRGATQFSNTVVKSTKYDMLQNQRQNVYRIIEDIGMQKGIERVRFFNKEGRIMYSTDKRETGVMVNKSAEACYACHAIGKPLEKLNTPKRTRVFSLDGHKVLGMITPIYNEPECSSASCHAHPAHKKVLGVFDITMSLSSIEQEIHDMEIRIIISGVLSVFIISIIISLFIEKFIDTPVKNLVEGTKRITEGDLTHPIIIQSYDELGTLANAFNDMMLKLKEAKEETINLVQTLEIKVNERTNELKKAQEQIVRAEKLASLGKLAATVAHEINNPLTGVLTYIKVLLKKFKQGNLSPEDFEKSINYLSVMEKETQRTSSIVKNLLDFSRQREPHYRLVDVNLLLDETIALINNMITIQAITINKSFSAMPLTMADPDQLKQAFMNVLINGCEAMKDNKKELYIETDNNDKNIFITIKDSGIGISEENLKKIFEPFFSTKEKGTGLGLAVVYGIISKHEGNVDIESKIGEGTTVKITLPIKKAI
ncbi:MAG: ATP-binding protein [Deltaproteobacteria bacterium]|nr:ATP-binding protein [Deltaproteobacteria bacterium]MCL5791983.1 ATP-binding protein [Deltaproteobacteria bacterium]